MMRILSLLVLLVVSSAWAEGQTRFQALNDYFNAGKLPEQSELMGTWAGRCYSAEKQNKATAAILVGATAKVHDQTNDGNQGPLFPPAPARLVYSVLLITPIFDVGADYYDNPTVDMLLAIKNIVKGVDIVSLESQSIEGAYVTVYKAGQIMYVTRQYNNYFIAKTMTLPDPENRKGSDTISTCYFFKKIM